MVVGINSEKKAIHSFVVYWVVFHRYEPKIKEKEKSHYHKQQ